MRSTLTYGSVRGAAREGRSYRDHRSERVISFCDVTVWKDGEGSDLVALTWSAI